MTITEMLQKIADEAPEPEQPVIIPEVKFCQRCRNIIEDLTDDGICRDCQNTLKRGYEISEMAGRCANGAERDHGTRWHARMLISNIFDNWQGADYTAICGAKPGRRSVGWSTREPEDRQVTCPRCLKKLERMSK